MVTAERHNGVDYLQLFEAALAELPDLQYLVTVGDEELWYDDRIFQFEDLVSKGAGRPVPAPKQVHDGSDLALLYTSGTMGKPKGVRLSHRGVLETAVRTGEAVEKPKIANSGTPAKMRSCGASSIASPVRTAVSMTPRWLRRTPLGLPMVPDV